MLSGSGMIGSAGTMDVRALFGANQGKSQPPYGQSVAAASGDIVEISELARNGISAVDPMSIFGMVKDPSGNGAYKTLDEVGQDFSEDLAGMQGVLGKFFRQMGVDPEQELVLQPDGRGHIRVTNQHPQGAAVQELFDRESPLTSRFMVMAARGTLTQVAETVPGFREAYAQDPVGAIEAHEDLLKERLLGFQLSAQGGTFTPRFAGEDWTYNANANAAAAL